MPAFSIIGELLMKTASFETDTGRAAKSLQRLQREAKATQTAFKASFAGNLVSDLAQQLGQTVARLPGQVLNGLDALNDLSDATGATVENLSALEHVAKLNGGTLENVGDILVKFNAALKNADGTDATSLALKQIGLDAKALKEIDPAEALRQTARALATFADDGNKARLVQELFGKSIKEAGPFLKDLAEQGQLNATVTTEQAKAAETLNKQIFALQTATSDAARALASDFIPKITELLKLYTDGKATGESFWAAIFGQTVQGKPTGQAEILTQDINRAVDSITRMQEELDRKGGEDSNLSLRIQKAKERVKALQDQAVATTKALGDLAESRQAYNDPANYDSRRFPSAPSVGKPPPKPAAAKKPTEFDSHVKAYIEENKRLADALADAQQAYESFYQQQQKTLDGFQQDAASAKELADTFGFTQEQLAKLNAEKLRTAAASLELLAINKGEKEGNEDLARLYREQAKALRARADAEDQLIQKQNKLDTHPLTGANKAVKDYLDNINKAGKATYDVVTGALQSLEDITVQALQGGNIKQAAKSLVNQIISEFYRLAVVRPLLNSIFSSGGGLEGILRLFNGGTFAGGNTTQSGPTGGFDFSGVGFPLASGTNYVPYDGFKATLHEGEAVVPKAYNKAAAGETTVQIINNTGAPVREERSESGGKKMVRLVIGEVARDMGRGGPTRQAARSAVGPGARRG